MNEEIEPTTETIISHLEYLINEIQAMKPGDRSEIDRLYAVGITETQRCLAWWLFVKNFEENQWQNEE